MDLTFPSSVVSWTETERRAWTPPDNLSTSEWADRHRILHPLTSAEPGKGFLNPDWVEWIMQWPVKWTSLEPMPPENFEAWLDLVGSGEWFAEDPADCGVVPRLASGMPMRKQRLMALGNGWVPGQALMAEAILWHLRL